MNTMADQMFTVSKEPRFLVRFPNWIGDAVMALPGLAALRRSCPMALIEILAKPWVADVLKMSPDCDNVIAFLDPGEHERLRGKLRLIGSLRGKYDAAVLFQNAIEAALITFTARIPLRGGYDTDMRGVFLTHPVPRPPKKGGETHQVNYYLDLVRSLGFHEGVEPIPRLVPERSDAVDGKTVSLAPGASYGPAKMWPYERFAELGKRFSDSGYSIVILGSSAEAAVCAKVAETIGHRARDLSGKTTLAEAAGIMASSRLVVCNDSGLMHLAGAVGSNLVALFGSTDANATGPVSDSAVILRGQASCAPCFLRECPTDLECFDDLTIEVVVEACSGILGEEL